MVFILDQGSEFKAPLNKVWELAQTEGVHKHSSQIDPQRSLEGERILLSFGQKLPDGTLVKHKVRIAPVPPVGMTIEYVEGPMTGSKLMQYYIPKGNKTGIKVVADVKAPNVSENQLKEMVMRQLETAFKEDEENLKKIM